jgi:hypothetical protein
MTPSDILDNFHDPKRHWSSYSALNEHYDTLHDPTLLNSQNLRKSLKEKHQELYLEILHEGWHNRGHAWIRSTRLWADHQPFTDAYAAIPAPTFLAFEEQWRSLGTQWLGDHCLYRQPHERSAFQYSYYHYPLQNDRRLIRHSRFDFAKTHHLILFELFPLMDHAL